MASILLIEDDDFLREALATALNERGHVVVQARDGNVGLRLFRASPIDLVLTDIVMPNKEGIELVMELRRSDPNLGIIAMSGAIDGRAPLYLKLGETLGANRTITKPFEFSVLLTLIDEVLAESRRRNESVD